MDYLVVPQQGSKISLPTIPLPSEPSFLHPALKGYAAAGAHTGFMTHADAHHVVPQMIQPSAAQPPAGTTRLTAAQAAELEMARRRAQKAAEGKRANATAARRAKRRAAEQADGSRQVPDLSAAQREREEREREEEEDEEMDGNDDLEARLANAKDEKETKRLKRLLRNRVSAQQARERKKSYVNGLEARVKAAEQKVAQAEQRVKTLERENGVLRNVIKNMQAYVDDHLLCELPHGGTLSSAAIVGQDGGIWAQSADFPAISSAEVEKLMGAFTQQKDLDALAGSGLYVGGVKYLVIPGDFGAVIRGKKGPEGITIKKTITALVLGSYGEGVQPADGNVVVEALGDYLIGQGI